MFLPKGGCITASCVLDSVRRHRLSDISREDLRHCRVCDPHSLYEPADHVEMVLVQIAYYRIWLHEFGFLLHESYGDLPAHQSSYPSQKPAVARRGQFTTPLIAWSPEALGALLMADAEDWLPLIKEFGIKAE
jgi:hypothetical protein